MSRIAGDEAEALATLTAAAPGRPITPEPGLREVPRHARRGLGLPDVSGMSA